MGRLTRLNAAKSDANMYEIMDGVAECGGWRMEQSSTYGVEDDRLWHQLGRGYKKPT